MLLTNSRLSVFRLIVVAGIIIAMCGGRAMAGVGPTEEAVAPDPGTQVAELPTNPSGYEVFDGFFVHHLVSWVVPETVPPEGVSRTGYVSVVTLMPGVAPVGTNSNDGWFALEVRSGAICYSLVALLTPTTTVSVQAAEGEVAPSVCATDGTTEEDIRTDCSGGSGCALQAGDVVLLPTGSILVQNGGIEHTYWNASDTARAVVVLTGHELDLPPGATPACVGGCWRW